MAIKYTNIFHRKSFQNLPKLGFLVWKYAIWPPIFTPSKKRKRKHASKNQKNWTQVLQQSSFPFSKTLALMGLFKEVMFYGYYYFKLSLHLPTYIHSDSFQHSVFVLPHFQYYWLELAGLKFKFQNWHEHVELTPFYGMYMIALPLGFKPTALSFLLKPKQGRTLTSRFDGATFLGKIQYVPLFRRVVRSNPARAEDGSFLKKNYLHGYVWIENKSC
jgi:hypothetical protein